MWPKFQHFAVDIPRHHREAERVRWALHIYTCYCCVLPHTLSGGCAFPVTGRLVNELYRTHGYSLHETPRSFRVDSGSLGQVAPRIHRTVRRCTRWWDMCRICDRMPRYSTPGELHTRLTRHNSQHKLLELKNAR